MAARALQCMGAAAAGPGGRARGRQGRPQQRPPPPPRREQRHQQRAEEEPEGYLQERLQAFSDAYLEQMRALPPGTAALAELPGEAEDVLWEVVRQVREAGGLRGRRVFMSLEAERVRPLRDY